MKRKSFKNQNELVLQVLIKEKGLQSKGSFSWELINFQIDLNDL